MNRGKDDPVSASPDTASTATSSDKGLDSRRWWALAAVSLAAFMTYLYDNINVPGDSPQSSGETGSSARMIDARYMPTPRVPIRSPTSETIM